LVELNHSARFWRLVTKLYPGYDRRQGLLDAHGTDRTATACRRNARAMCRPMAAKLRLEDYPEVARLAEARFERRASACHDQERSSPQSTSPQALPEAAGRTNAGPTPTACWRRGLAADIP